MAYLYLPNVFFDFCSRIKVSLHFAQKCNVLFPVLGLRHKNLSLCRRSVPNDVIAVIISFMFEAVQHIRTLRIEGHSYCRSTIYSSGLSNVKSEIRRRWVGVLNLASCLCSLPYRVYIPWYVVLELENV